MIFKKPYAFLIKNFRLFHLILAIIMGYLVYQTNLLSSFFKEYLVNNKVITKAVKVEIVIHGALTGFSKP